MGTQIKKGIADEYETINPTMAMKMLDLAFNGVNLPDYEKISKEELSFTYGRIIPLSKTG